MTEREYYFNYQQAYARLWECCLADLAGCSKEFVQNEAQLSLSSATEGISDARRRMISQFCGDLEHTGLPAQQQSRAMFIAYQVTHTTSEDLRAYDAELERRVNFPPLRAV